MDDREAAVRALVDDVVAAVAGGDARETLAEQRVAGLNLATSLYLETPTPAPARSTPR